MGNAKRPEGVTLPERPVLRGWSHVLAAVAAAVLAPILIRSVDGSGAVTAASIYAVGVVALFAVSAVYHRVFFTTRFAATARRLDHSMIFIFIAATYTPVAAMILPRRSATIVLLIVWIGAAFGIGIKMFWLNAPRWATVGPYLAVGWCILPFLGQVIDGLETAGFVLLAAGGLVYTVGAIVYATRRPNPSPRWFGYHETFHLLVVGAVALHYVSIAFYALP